MTKVRRRRELVCRWVPEGLEVGVPGQQQWVRLSPELVTVMERAGAGIEVDDLACGFGPEHERAVRAAIDGLTLVGVLESPDVVREDPPLWDRWGGIAERFHTEARDADYLVDGPERAEEAGVIVAQGGAPDSFKQYLDRPVVLLPRQPLALNASVGWVFAGRRTHRRFTRDPVSLDQLGTLLFHSFAPHRFTDGGVFGVQQCRVSASAGARHEVEAYVVVYQVTGIPPGLYHYSAARHALELLDDDVPRERVAELSYGQEASYQGAFTVLTTAVANRLAWKYRHPRAYRLWMYDAGHYGQTFALAATALGLGPFQTVAFQDSAVEDLLGVDPDEEFAVYLLAAGVPDAPTALLPGDFAFPPPGTVH
ncbi:SagB/ThcOx family dehydrogenase [Streptomyces sp. RKAG293]|uniref:SagB/ThcOx family dehydrogenase n=1 Tax=Streptomyces sp. RKAG293 TaxID=2893403 RepID=UPI0020349C3E|nr:SagB/ThcOx family dehydrogenase [Streptomyces sp. RKAG293]MCM2416653.1 SagB/ThcOx family dehydrogenase [Streptomyces sp. RKAG293]